MQDKLKEYNKKRDFYKTAEPQGADKEKSNPVLRYVIQHHMSRREHYDFRLEWNGVLLSWAVPKGPSYNPKDKRLAIQVEDHPLDYRNFEGTIPQGQYGGGTVMLWDEGHWLAAESDVDKAIEKGEVKFVLLGKRLKGLWVLVKLKDTVNWLLIKEKDEYAKTSADIDGFTISIRTGRTMSEISNS